MDGVRSLITDNRDLSPQRSNRRLCHSLDYSIIGIMCIRVRLLVRNPWQSGPTKCNQRLGKYLFDLRPSPPFGWYYNINANFTFSDRHFHRFLREWDRFWGDSIHCGVFERKRIRCVSNNYNITYVRFVYWCKLILQCCVYAFLCLKTLFLSKYLFYKLDIILTLMFKKARSQISKQLKKLKCNKLFKIIVC